MALNLDPQCRRAIDLAKRALPEGQELDAGLLIEALYHSTDLHDRFPGLDDRLPRPEEVRETIPESVPVSKPVQAALKAMAGSADPVTPLALLRALVADPTVGEMLATREIEFGDLSTGGTSGKDAGRVGGGDGWRGSDERRAVIEALSSYGRMLTTSEVPHKGVTEMESVLESLIRALSRMKRRNAIIVGFPGTGKSAVIYELARRVVERHESLPEHLLDVDIFELSPSFLRSGASMVGQYDERVKALIEVLTTHPKVILFVDEIHSLLQSGLHERGPFTDANESLKGVLGRGEITCLGCTTLSEYRHYIQPDPAWERRFSIIRLDPPSPEATVRILRSRLPRIEAYYAPLKVPDPILDRTVELAEQYLVGRYQPDKSIQLLDEACAHCRTTKPPRPEVTEEALFRALADVAGHDIVRTDVLTSAEVFDRLRAKIVGQDAVLRELATAFVAGLGDWSKRSGPRGVFLFCGPTGVGKTEAAVLLADILGGDRKSLVRIDCNTLQGSGHDSGPARARLLGAPPGYIGYVRGQGGLLSRIRDFPSSIVLFDEFEKADPGVGELLLQILDEGRIDDNDGNLLDFRRAFIVFTTNAGAVYEQKRQIGLTGSYAPDGGSPRVDTEAMKLELRARGLGEEFLGRISHVFAFKSLDQEAVREVLAKQLQRLREAAEARGFDLATEDGLIDYLAAQWQPRFGVRHLITILTHRITEQLDIADAQGELRGVSRIMLGVLAPEEAEPLQVFSGVASRQREDDTLIIRVV